MANYSNLSFYNEWLTKFEPVDEVEQFLKKYRAVAELDRQYAYVIDESRQFNYTSQYMSAPTRVPVYNVRISEDQLKRLVNNDNSLDMAHRYAEASREKILQMERESRLRESNPSVQKAYEKYQMLLKLAYGDKL